MLRERARSIQGRMARRAPGFSAGMRGCNQATADPSLLGGTACEVPSVHQAERGGSRAVVWYVHVRKRGGASHCPGTFSPHARHGTRVAGLAGIVLAGGQRSHRAAAIWATSTTGKCPARRPRILEHLGQPGASTERACTLHIRQPSAADGLNRLRPFPRTRLHPGQNTGRHDSHRRKICRRLHPACSQRHVDLDVVFCVQHTLHMARKLSGPRSSAQPTGRAAVPGMLDASLRAAHA